MTERLGRRLGRLYADRSMSWLLGLLICWLGCTRCVQRARCPMGQLRRQDGGVPSRRRFPDSVGAAPIAGNNSKYRRKRHIKTKTMLSTLYLDIQASRAVTFCRFSGTLFVSENRQIVLLNLVFKCHSRWYVLHLNQLKAILNFLLRWRCL